MELARLPFLVFAALITLAGCTHYERRAAGPLQHDSQSVELDKAEKVNVDLRMGAGELKVTGGAAKLLEADFAYTDVAMRPTVHYSPGSLNARLSIEEPHHVGPSMDGRYDWSLRLNDKVPMELDTRLGAGNVEMNLGSLTLRGIEVHMGVGNLDLDLRGDPKHDYDVQIRGGVGNATVRLPTNANIIAEAKGGIGNIEAHGLEKHNGEWTNTPSAGAKATIHLDIHGGVGNITLEAK